MPRLRRWTAGYYPYRQSGHAAKLYDQPELALEIIQQILALNPSLHSSLGPDYADSAKANPALAPQLLTKCLASIQEQPCILLVDEINALYAPTAYRSVEGEPLGVAHLPVLQTMRSFFERPSEHTLLLGALCHDPGLQKFMIPPRALSTTQTTRLDYLSRAEVKSLLAYYHSTGHVLQDVNSDDFAEKIRFISGGAGDKVLSAATYDGVYYSPHAPSAARFH